MNPPPERPHEFQPVLDLLNESKAPPADTETPGIPAEMLEQLTEQYGSPEPQRVPRQIVEEKTSLWQQILALFAQPKFAFAMATVLALIGIGVLVQPTSDKPADLMRGPDDHPAALPTYWLTPDAQAAPTGLGMPTFLVISTPEALPAKGEYLLFDPTKAQASRIKDTQPQLMLPITSPNNPDEWLDAHRQLSK